MNQIIKNKKGSLGFLAKLFNPKVLIVVALILILIIVGNIGTGSLIGNSGMRTSLSISEETAYGVQFSMGGNSEDNVYGADRNLGTWSGTQVFTGSFSHNPSDSASYPIVSNIDGDFPFDNEKQYTDKVSLSFLMWVRPNGASGDWSKWVGGSSTEGYAYCKPINKGNPILPSQRVENSKDFYSGLTCDFVFNVTCPYAECEMRSLRTVGVNVYIPKITNEIIIEDQGEEPVQTEDLQSDVGDSQTNSYVEQPQIKKSFIQRLLEAIRSWFTS